MCRCGLKYVGKTIRELRQRIGEHVSDINKSQDTPIARHVVECHSGNAAFIKFQGIDGVKRSLAGGDVDRILLQKEAQWIFRLGTIKPNGLNNAISYVSFI